MKRLILLIVVLMFALTPILAQEMGIPKPAQELGAFKKLIGHWQGSGTTTMAPGAPPGKWTSKSTFQFVLDGHFLREDVRVDFEGGAMPTMLFRSYYGWDRNNKQLVSYTIGSTGDLEISSSVTWPDANTLIILCTIVKDGEPIIQRSVMTFSGDEYTLKMQTARGASDLQTWGEGKIKRAESGYTISDEELKQGMVAASEGMQKLHSICGSYTMKGEMVPAPGAPTMTITSKETIQPCFNGSVLQFWVKGDPMPGDTTGFRYEGLAFLVWDAHKECYNEVYLNNMGESSIVELRWIGEKSLVSTRSGVQYGLPTVSRATLELNDAGAIQKVSMDSMNSNHGVVRAFMGEYTKTDKTDKVNKAKP